MKCKNCGAIIHEGDTFCHMCARPINQDDYVSTSTNNATSTFKNVKNLNIVKKVEEKIDLSKYHIAKEESKQIENKDLIKQDSNDRVKATLINFGGLFIILLIIFIVVKLILNIVSRL